METEGERYSCDNSWDDDDDDVADGFTLKKGKIFKVNKRIIFIMDFSLRH